MAHVQFLKVIDEPFLSFSRSWRKAYEDAHAAYAEFAKERGAASYFTHAIEGFLIALTVVDPLPPGWKHAKGLRVGHAPRIVPKSSDENPEWHAMAALPRPMGRHEIQKITGIPSQLSYKYGEQGWHGKSLGTPFAEFQMLWVGETFVIYAPDYNEYVRQALREHPDAAIETLSKWVLPAGLERITQAQWELIAAQHRVQQEAAQ